jgi:hypothetical protein
MFRPTRLQDPADSAASRPRPCVYAFLVVGSLAALSACIYFFIAAAMEPRVALVAVYASAVANWTRAGRADFGAAGVVAALSGSGSGGPIALVVDASADALADNFVSELPTYTPLKYVLPPSASFAPPLGWDATMSVALTIGITAGGGGTLSVESVPWFSVEDEQISKLSSSTQLRCQTCAWRACTQIHTHTHT